MLLIGVKEENGWISSRWNLTYRTSWERILKALSLKELTQNSLIDAVKANL